MTNGLSKVFANP